MELGKRLLGEIVQESAVELLSDIRAARPRDGPWDGVIEISSDRTSGKTQLLYHIVASIQGEVVVIDCDGRFDKFASNVHLFRPQSSASLVATLAAMPDYLFSNCTSPLDLVAIDGISAFYWHDRLASQPVFENEARPTLQQTFTHIVRHLITLRRTFSCNIIITNIAIPPMTIGKIALPNHLPPIYANIFTSRLVLVKDAVAQFHAGMGWKEAWNERNMRQEVVNKSGISAWTEKGWLWFQITEDGLLVDY